MKHLRPRTWKSIVAKAARLGLPRGVPQGCESIASAARRTGYCAQTLVNILHKYGVEIRYCYMFYRKNKRLKPRRYVDSFEVDEAIEKHMSTETLHAAAAARGIHSRGLWQKLKRRGLLPEKPDGYKRRPPIRLPSHLYDMVIKDDLRKRRRVATVQRMRRVDTTQPIDGQEALLAAHSRTSALPAAVT